MRNFKKLLVVICVIALLTVGCVLTAFAAKDGTVEELNALISSANAETDPVAKYNAVIAVDAYLDERNISWQAGYDEALANAQKLYVSSAVALLDSIKADMKA